MRTHKVVSISIEPDLLAAAKDRARKLHHQNSFSAYIQRLIENDLATPAENSDRGTQSTPVPSPPVRISATNRTTQPSPAPSGERVTVTAKGMMDVSPGVADRLAQGSLIAQRKARATVREAEAKKGAGKATK